MTWIIAGSLAIFIAVVHGWLGATKVVSPVNGITPPLKRILHAIFFLSAVYWAAAGLGLILLAGSADDPLRALVGWVALAIFLSGAAANAWATRGRHFGWMLLALTSGLTVAGL